MSQARPGQTPYVGTAGWAIPRAVAGAFGDGGSVLERYATRFRAVEINSTFYRSHRPATYARWATSTPPDFRFAVKLPKSITHEARLREAMDLVAPFRAQVEPLGPKLGPLLVQLPPSLTYDEAVAERFFHELRDRWTGPIVCEPRHPTWFDAGADQLLAACHVARVAADPARHPAASRPGGWTGLSYWRLHGSPQMYRSPYAEPALQAIAAEMARAPGEAWCIFDNTTSGAAAANALRLDELLA